ncbi:MAG: hypothetical protein PHX83_16480 [Acidobacteriia bacterium]|nr:hypothetical protein [Terriglobia bacterium]
MTEKGHPHYRGDSTPLADNKPDKRRELPAIPESKARTNDFIDESHPAITEHPNGSFDVDMITRRLLSEGYDETNIIAALIMRLHWLDRQKDTTEELNDSALTLRVLAIHKIRERLHGVLQGVKAALVYPDLFRALLHDGDLKKKPPPI